MSELAERVETSVQPQPHAEAHDHAHSDTVTLPVLGTITVPGGMYTVVFGMLAVLTALEVLIYELLKGADEPLFAIRSVALFIISLGKAGLVVWYYMHLKTDNPIFRIILIVPVIVVVISVVYLVGVPVGAGGGYR
ncbi:cytochrome C oxidase subunit IV family protein [Aggregatilineales bacterium SYSU G02658]